MLGVIPAIVPDDQTGAGLAQTIAAEFPDPVPLLLIRGTKSSNTFQEKLRSLGWTVDELIVYENVPASPEPLGRIDDCIAVFASPSAAECFFGTNPELAATAKCVAIGEVTARRLTELGAQSIAVATRPAQQDLVDAVSKLCNEGSRI